MRYKLYKCKDDVWSPQGTSFLYVVDTHEILGNDTRHKDICYKLLWTDSKEYAGDIGLWIHNDKVVFESDNLDDIVVHLGIESFL